MGGEWKVTFASGETGFHAWQWGPGRHSIRQVSHLSRADSNPWAGEILYWHPTRKQVRLLSLHGDIPGVGRGVTEGAVAFSGDTETAVLDLYQPAGRRTIGNRRTFDGPDAYHEELLEDTGHGLQPLNSWQFVRVPDRALISSAGGASEPKKLPPRLAFFQSLLGRAWNAGGETTDAFASTHGSPTLTTFEFVPSLEVVYVRVSAPGASGEAAHQIDAYFYHHLGTDTLRCLAFSREGVVFEGDVSVPDARSMQIDLIASIGGRSVPCRVSLTIGPDGHLRSRVWSVTGGDRALLIDRHHKQDP